MDIAHSLSMTCRYRGHSQRFYSVAEHSVLVSRMVPPDCALWALLHDASEAYSADIPAPIKDRIPGWGALEDAITSAVAERFGLSVAKPWPVEWADKLIVADEQDQLFSRVCHGWERPAQRLGVTLRFLAPDQAKDEFLLRFSEITSG